MGILYIKGKKTYSLFCVWPFPRHSRPSSHGQIWLMLKASPPSGTKQLSPRTSRRLHTLSPWWRAQHIEAPQSLSTLHRAPETMRTTDSLHLDTDAKSEFIMHWHSCAFNWPHRVILPLPSCPSGMLRMHLPNMQLSPCTHWASRRQYFPSCLRGTHRPKWRSQEKPFPQEWSCSQATYNQMYLFKTKFGQIHANSVACFTSELTMVEQRMQRRWFFFSLCILFVMQYKIAMLILCI